MKCKFSIPCPPFSINAVNNINGKRRGRKVFPSKDYLAWRSVVFEEMNKPSIQQKLNVLKSYWNEETMGIEFKVTFFMPKNKLFTRKGTLHIQSKDLTNVEKPLVDLIFDERFMYRPLQGGGKINNLAIDDKNIVNLTSSKRVSEDEVWNTEIEIGLLYLSRP